MARPISHADQVRYHRLLDQMADRIYQFGKGLGGDQSLPHHADPVVAQIGQWLARGDVQRCVRVLAAQLLRDFAVSDCDCGEPLVL